MSIEVIKAGLLNTIVDRQRLGFRSLGVGSGGAMDGFAATVGNYLVGNDEVLPSIEIHFPSPEFLFHSSALISITGSGCDVVVDDKRYDLWTPLWITKGSKLKLTKTGKGSRAYLSVHGGFIADQWLGSCTTHLRVEAGGYHGRALQSNDKIETRNLLSFESKNRKLPWAISKTELQKVYEPRNEVRCIEGAETIFLYGESLAKLFSSDFTMLAKSDRMGLRLLTDGLLLNAPIELVSSPVDFGTVQLLPDGNLIVLMADHQTTGGYPRVATVLECDLAKLSQLDANEKVKFKLIPFQEADALSLMRATVLTELRAACLSQFKKMFE